MWARIGNFLIAMVIRLVAIALALGVLLLGIAVMLKEPQGIVAIGTLVLCAAIIWVGFSSTRGDDLEGDAASKGSEGSGPSPEG